jgi:hypothetical protein
MQGKPKHTEECTPQKKSKQTRNGVCTDQTVPIFLRVGIRTYNPRYKAYWYVTPDCPDSHMYPTLVGKGTHHVS